MATYELFSPVERQSFIQIPETMDERVLARYYLLSPQDLVEVNRHRGRVNRLGFAVLLSYLRFPGRAWEQGEIVPPFVLEYLASQLRLSPRHLLEYARERPNTRREHLEELYILYNFQAFTTQHYQELSNWLLVIGLSTDNSLVLMQALIEELRHRQIVLPAFYQLEKLVWEVKKDSETQLFSLLTAGLSRQQQQKLDDLVQSPAQLSARKALEAKPEQGPKPEDTLNNVQDKRQSDLAWLRRPVGKNSPASFNKLAERIEFIRELKLDPNITKKIHHNRLLQLAREGSRSTAGHLSELEAPRRHAILVAFVLDWSERLTDQALEMHINLVGQLFNKSERKQASYLHNSGKAFNEKVLFYAQVGKAVIEAKAQDGDPYEAIEAVMEWPRFVASVEEAEKLARPKDFDYLDLMASRYSWLRQYSKKLLDVFEFKAAPASQSLKEALDLLKELNTDNSRKVPQDAPRSFIKPRWEKHVFPKEGVIDRRFYEMCILAELRNGLRSGDLWVSSSHQFRAFEEYLIGLEEWSEIQKSGKLALAISLNFKDYIEERAVLLNQKLLEVEQLISKGLLPDLTIKDNEFHLAALTKAVPDEAEALKEKAYDLLPRIKITDMLLEIEALTGFSRHFTHQQTTEVARDKLALLTAILADGLNLGLTKMAESCPGMTYGRLAWAADWHLREETYRKALAELVNFQHHLPFAAHYGEGKTSSSDGQRFKKSGHKEPTAQVNLKYGTEPGVMIYTHLSDQYVPFYVKVISTTARQAPYVIDGLLYHESELKIEEHYTDTHGFTEQIFGAANILGFRFAPRIKDIGDKRLYSFSSMEAYPNLKGLFATTHLNVKMMSENWNDLLRLFSSIQRGNVPASLILTKLAAYPRQNRLALTLREMGRLEKTLFTLNWLKDPPLRRRVTGGLNKGESRNSLARAVFYNRLGEMRDRTWEDQLSRASGLTLLTAVIATWNTLYLEKAIVRLRELSIEVKEEYLPHVSPLGWQHLTLNGDYIWNTKQPYNLDNPRPLRVRRPTKIP